MPSANQTKLQIEITQAADAKFIGYCEDSVSFWNREGKKTYDANLNGTLGSRESNNFAKRTKFADWILAMLVADFKAANQNGYAIGQGGHHVFVANQSGRILMASWGAE